MKKLNLLLSSVISAILISKLPTFTVVPSDSFRNFLSPADFAISSEVILVFSFMLNGIFMFFVSTSIVESLEDSEGELILRVLPK